MEKIHIQFSESEYEIYHNYCFRYYTVYDTTRKRSIHLFRELFEKDILPVGEHDIDEAFLFLSKKCDELQSDNPFGGENNSFRDFPQFQVCRDLQFLIEDFEKIYRLIEKTGISANYLLVLATFSRIIEEEKQAYISASNEQEQKKIESCAPAIADIIRTRFGADAEWETVLSELTRIVRRFNAVSPGLKIDKDTLSLIGTAVVLHFNVAVGPEKIQTTVGRYFEECELAEFESVLNNTPYPQDNDTYTDPSDSVIFNTLKSISGRDIKQESRETMPSHGLFETAGLPAVISHNSAEITPLKRTFTHYTGRKQENSDSRFAICMSGAGKSIVVLPEKRENFLYAKPGIPQYSMMFMGIVIMILLAVTMAATSGIWNMNTMDNSSTGITSNVSNPVVLQKSPLQPPKNIAGSDTGDPLQKNPSLDAKEVSGNQVADKKDVTVQFLTTKTALTSADINKYFMQVAFGDNTVIKKASNEHIVLALAGGYDDSDIAFLNDFITRFNNASATNKIHEGIKFGDQATIVMTLLPENALQGIENPAATVISKNQDTGVIRYLHKTVTVQFVSKEALFINSDYRGVQKKHWILRGLLSQLGFMGETSDYQDSIFYEGSDNTTSLSDMDIKAIEIMYGKKITPGMTFDRTKSLLMVS